MDRRSEYKVFHGRHADGHRYMKRWSVSPINQRNAQWNHNEISLSTPVTIAAIKRLEIKNVDEDVETKSNTTILLVGFPSSANGKDPACQCRRHKRREFNPSVGKIP